ncbi:MAG: Crp/Fnr family transcriptional regulator [Cytophagales bacterium]
MVAINDFERIREYVLRFVQFTDEDLEFFRGILYKREIPKGKFLLEAGDVCRHVAFINKGHFRSFSMVGDEEITYNFAFDGNFITDYSSFVTQQPSHETHQALENAEVLILEYTTMQEGYRVRPIFERFGRLIAEFIIVGIVQRNRSLLFLTPEERYLDLMKVRPKVIANIPQQYIAAYLGIQPESLSRIRKRLAEAKKL